MDYQQLPTALAIAGLPAPAQSPHIQQIMQNNANNVPNVQQLLTSMQPPPVPVNNNIPLQQNNVHTLAHINSLIASSNNNTNNNNNNSNNNNNNVQNNNHHNTQNLPPPSQLLQLHHQHVINNNNNNNNAATNNNNNNNNTEEGNRWTQFQVQQLWRHHAYLNGNVFIFDFFFIISQFLLIIFNN